MAIEPQADHFPELTTPLGWREYSASNITIIKKCAGNVNDNVTTTLDAVYDAIPEIHGKRGFIKIDVEGAEEDVLLGASHLLQENTNDWLVEIHGRSRIPSVAKFFVNRDRPFLIKDLTAIPFLKPEKRSIDTYWLLTI